MSRVMLIQLIIPLLAFVSQPVAGSPTTIFYVDPPSIVDPTLTPGSSFTVNVLVSDAVDLFAWQVDMRWDTAVLNATGIIFGDFLAHQPQGTGQAHIIYNEEGRLLVFEGTIGAYPGVDGYGWLFSVAFLVEASGETVLDIGEGTWCWDSYMNSVELIKENGYFSNYAISATIDIDPDMLNLRSGGQWITCYIELPEGYNVSDIDVSTVMLNDTIPVSLLDVPAPEPIPTEIGDYDNDTIPDLMVKFNRTLVSELILSNSITDDHVALTVTGEVAGTPFRGEDTIEVILGAGGSKSRR